LTLVVPSLTGKATLPFAISAAPSMARGAPITLQQLLATDYNAKVSLDIGGTAYTADARTLLQAASTAHACKPWGTQCNLWLAGPITSE